jgi:hypothetical protein
MIEIS